MEKDRNDKNLDGVKEELIAQIVREKGWYVPSIHSRYLEGRAK